MHILGVDLLKLHSVDIQEYLRIEERLSFGNSKLGIKSGRPYWVLPNPLSGDTGTIALTLEIRTAILLGCLGLYASWFKTYRLPSIEANAGGYFTLGDWMHQTTYAVIPTDPQDENSPPRRVSHAQRIREWLTIPLLTKVAGLHLDEEGCIDDERMTPEAKETWARVITILMRIVGSVGTGEAQALIKRLEQNREEVFMLDQRRPNVHGFIKEYLPRSLRTPPDEADVNTFRRELTYGLHHATDMTLRALAHFSLSIAVDLPDSLWIVARAEIVGEQVRRANLVKPKAKVIIRPAEPDYTPGPAPRLVARPTPEPAPAPDRALAPAPEPVAPAPEPQLELADEPQRPVKDVPYRSRLVETVGPARVAASNGTRTYTRKPRSKAA